MNDNAYEGINNRIDCPSKLLVGKESMNVNIGSDFFVPSVDVPKDVEDVKMEADRQRAADQHRNQKKKEKKEARDREKAERQNELARHVRASYVVFFFFFFNIFFLKYKYKKKKSIQAWTV